MKYLPYILRHLRRNWIRTGSTVIAISVAIFLFCTLQTFLGAIDFALKSANDKRLAVRHAVSIVFNLPLTYKQRIANIEGVRRVATASWFGGVMGSADNPDFRNFFPNLAVDGEEFLAIYPEFVLPEEQKKAWLADRRGAIVGRKTAERFGWKIGDMVQLESFIPPYRIGRPFEFVLQGIYDGDLVRNPGADTTLLLFHQAYLYEATNQRVGAGYYMVEVEDASRGPAIARAIDAMFENTNAATRTETEAAFMAGFINMAGNLPLLLKVIGLAVTFTILLVTANTMSMAVRERRNEIAVLKTLGFPSALVMALVLSEALVIGALGGALGLFLGNVVIRGLPEAPFIGDFLRQFPHFALSPLVATLGFGIALLVGFSAGFVPALLAYRARITEMLRQV